MQFTYFKSFKTYKSKFCPALCSFWNGLNDQAYSKSLYICFTGAFPHFNVASYD